MKNPLRSTLFVIRLVLIACLHVLATPVRAHLDPILDAEDRLDPFANVLIEGIGSPSADMRGRVALAYGRMQKPEGIDALLRLSGDRDPSVRAQALFALGQFAWRAEFALGREDEIADRIAGHLGERDEYVRAAAVEALGKIGFLRVPSLVTPLLADAVAQIRAEALMSLFRYRYVYMRRNPGTPVPMLPQESLERMPALVGDPDVAVRRNLAYNFVRYVDPRGLPIVLRLVDDADAWVRLHSVNSLARIGDPVALRAVRLRLDDADARVRWAAVHALAALKQPEYAGSRRSDPDPHVRSAVAAVLGDVPNRPGDRTIRWLRQLAADSSIEVRAVAVNGLARGLGSDAWSDVETALDHPSPVLRAAAIRASRYLTQDQRALVIGAAKPDPDPIVQDALLNLLATVDGPAAYAFIGRRLESPYIDIRTSALQALAARGEADAPRLCWRTYRANPGWGKTNLRMAAVQTMAKFSGEDSSRYLRAMLEDEVFAVGMLAFDALIARGVSDIVRPSETLTFTPYRDLRVSDHPLVVLNTERGVILLQLDAVNAPIHVANFVGMVQDRLFDGKTWQRVVPNFVVQGGSPSVMGAAAQEYFLRAEIGRRHFRRGAIGMSRSDLFNTGDSELFITHVPAPHLDGQYTLFGQVIYGMDTVDRLEAFDRIITARLIRR
ncbi:MAG: HEAT repeat domain-containing protein [Methylotetracoccus sp.]